MESLKAIAVADLSIINVNGTLGKNIFDAAKECLYISNLLKVVVVLYWNGKSIRIYKSDKIEDVVNKIKNT